MLGGNLSYWSQHAWCLYTTSVIIKCTSLQKRVTGFKLPPLQGPWQVLSANLCAGIIWEDAGCHGPRTCQAAFQNFSSTDSPVPAPQNIPWCCWVDSSKMYPQRGWGQKLFCQHRQRLRQCWAWEDKRLELCAIRSVICPSRIADHDRIVQGQNSVTQPRIDVTGDTSALSLLVWRVHDLNLQRL